MTDVLIVDGSGFAHRAQGVMHLNTERGEDTSIVFGFLNMLRSQIIKHSPADVVIAWDGAKYKEAKRKLYPEYKTNRVKTDDMMQIWVEIRRQIGELQKVLPALGIRQLRRDPLEADDVIGILCEGLKGKKILIVTGDRDLFQLVSKTITIYYTNKAVYITPENFEQEAEVSLDNFIFYKCIIGDTGDNVKGLKGIGPVTAKKLLKEYGPWTDWFENEEPKHEILKSVNDRQQHALLDNSLAVLVRNYQVMGVGFTDNESIDDLMGDYYNQVPRIDEGLLKAHFLDKQFASMTKRFEGWIMPFTKLVYRGSK